MFWALLCPIQVSFQVQVGPKMGDLWLKNSQNDRLPYWAKKSTWKLDNAPKHTPTNGERCFGHFYAPSRCQSRSRWVQKWGVVGIKKQPKWGGENRHGHLDFVLDFVLGFSCMGDGESTCAQNCRAAAAASRNKYHPTTRTQKPVQCVKTWDFYKKGAGYSEWLG